MRARDSASIVFVIGLVLGGTLAAAAPLRTPPEQLVSPATVSPSDPPLRRYLTREMAYSARQLDHGVLEASTALGWPHRYALRVRLGLLDHLCVGLQTHWLPNPRSRVQISPEVAVAFIRMRKFEWGAYYRQVFHPASEDDLDPDTRSFSQRDHWFLTHLSFSSLWLSGGLDFGLLRARLPDPGQDATEDFENPSIMRWRLGGGLHLRGGTRRWGITASVLAPQWMAEIAFDVRFSLFEMRPKGGWRPAGIVSATDRRVPTWR